MSEYVHQMSYTNILSQAGYLSRYVCMISLHSKLVIFFEDMRYVTGSYQKVQRICSLYDKNFSKTVLITINLVFEWIFVSAVIHTYNKSGWICIQICLYNIFAFKISYLFWRYEICDWIISKSAMNLFFTWQKFPQDSPYNNKFSFKMKMCISWDTHI